MLHTTDTNILPPHSAEAEMCLLASLMLDRERALQILPTLRAADFFLTDHAIIFEALAPLITAGRSVDAIILRDELKRANLLEKIGGTAYVAQILSTVPSAAHASEYAARVREHSGRRKLLALADGIMRRVQSDAGDAVTLAADLVSNAQAIIADRSAGDLIDWSDLIEQTYNTIGDGGVETVMTGFRDFDAITGGIGLGETVVVAARPSMGKSTFARTVAVNAAKLGYPVGIISLEESAAKIGRNAMAAESSIENKRLRASSDLKNEDYTQLGAATTRLQKLPIVLSKRARSVADIRAAAFAMKAKHGTKLLIIDHLSRIRAPGSKSLYEQITHASGAISDMIKDLPVAGMVLCQLNRGLEQRDDKRPTMSDLRESGAIEEDADGVILLHREDYYHLGDASYIQDGVCDAIIAKWRDGRRGLVVKLASELRFQRFRDAKLADAHPL